MFVFLLTSWIWWSKKLPNWSITTSTLFPPKRLKSKTELRDSDSGVRLWVVSDQQILSSAQLLLGILHASVQRDEKMAPVVRLAMGQKPNR